MKKIILTILLVFTIFVVSACETEEPTRDVIKDDNPTELLELTIEELAMYNGEDGNDAYIAVGGVIYDVTGVSAWSSGTHNGGMVGTDVSDLIGSAPHGDSVLDDLDVVGNIVE